MSGNRTITLAEINAQSPGLENREVDEIIVHPDEPYHEYYKYCNIRKTNVAIRMPKLLHTTKVICDGFHSETFIPHSIHPNSVYGKHLILKASKPCVPRAGCTFNRYTHIDVYGSYVQFTYDKPVKVVTYWNIESVGNCSMYSPSMPYAVKTVIRGGSLYNPCAIHSSSLDRSYFIYDQTKPVHAEVYNLQDGEINEFLLDNFTEATLILNVVARMTIIGGKSEVRSRLTLRATFIGELVIKNTDVTLLNTPECREVTLVNSSCTGEPLTTLLRFTASGSSGRFLDQRVNPPSCRDITPEASWTYEDGAFQFPEARAFPVESDLEIIYEPDDPDMYLE